MSSDPSRELLEPGAGSRALIELRNVGKSYDGGRTYAVHDVTLDVYEGELLVLLGASGCGKTTVLKMINRLEDHSHGEIRVDGQNVRDSDPIFLRRSIGYVIQTVGLFPHLTVGENIATVPRLFGWERQRIARRVDELIRLVHLDPEEYRHRPVSALSGGQAQRVGFARALGAGPQIMLLDEPFGALDPITRVGLQQEFKEIQRTLGLTAVMVTHDMAEALELADRIAVLHEGEILQIATPRELLQRPAHEFVQRLVDVPRKALELLDMPSSSSASRVPYE